MEQASGEESRNRASSEAMKSPIEEGAQKRQRARYNSASQRPVKTGHTTMAKPAKREAA